MGIIKWKDVENENIELSGTSTYNGSEIATVKELSDYVKSKNTGGSTELKANNISVEADDILITSPESFELKTGTVTALSSKYGTSQNASIKIGTDGHFHSTDIYGYSIGIKANGSGQPISLSANGGINMNAYGRDINLSANYAGVNIETAGRFNITGIDIIDTDVTHLYVSDDGTNMKRISLADLKTLLGIPVTVALTQEEYDAITPDSDTYYYIYE